MLWLIVIILSVASFCSCESDDIEWREVRIAQGTVRGRMDPDGGLYTFYNIPYATAPTGKDRFKAPLPGPMWIEPLEAVDRGIICMQEPVPNMDIDSKTMQEDCLVANIFVPDTSDKNLPVIIYIHGGAFEIGYGNMLTPKNLVKHKKIIVITFNYRLGVLGFLCLGTKDAPGNAGMKDQVALLQWVKENISIFGGNPEDVTIAGYSAGSVSADLIMLSKSAEGLFNKVVLESGSNVASIAVQMNPLENARAYAKMLNLTDVDDFFTLQEFYLNTPVKSLIRNTFFGNKYSTNSFAPCVEQLETGDEIFLHDAPVKIIKKGDYKKVPILIGINPMEGLLQIHNLVSWKDAMNENFSDFLPSDLFFENEEDKEEISDKIIEFYFGFQPVGEKTIMSFIEYFGDIMFAYPTLRSVKLHIEAGHQQIYLYEYAFADNNTPKVPFTNIVGVGHCAQTMAVLDGTEIDIPDETNISEDFKQMKATIRELWYNFAVHGKPVPEGSSLIAWPPTGANGAPYMTLGNLLVLQDVGLLEEFTNFWDEIYETYYREPVPPSQPPPVHSEL